MDTSNWTVDDHIDWIRKLTDISRYMNEVKLNVQVTTMTYYMGLDYATQYDLVDVNEKYRAMGVIR